MAAAIDFRPEDPAFVADPYPLFRRMREEDPVHWSPRLKAWVLTRYDDVRAVCTDAEASSDRLRPFFAALPSGEAERIADIVRYLTLWMVFRDPPEHTRVRKLASRVLNVQSMHAMRPAIESLVDSLLEGLEDRAEIDLIADFAGPLPALVIMAMLGVPREALARVKRLSDEMALFIGSSRMAPDKYDRAEAATREMAALFRDLIAARRAAPGEDILSRLVHISHEGERLSDDELVATSILLLFAGHETTTNAIANGLLALLRFPEAAQALRDDPGLAGKAVEELLRYDGPGGALVRIARAERRMGGRLLEPGDRVFLMLNAANRDPAAYPDPDRVILRRDGVPHLAFGFGPHLCLGFPLARLEAQVALPAILRRWPGLALAVPAGELQWLSSMVFRGMKALPLRVRG
jgi:cytochrome P450